jgi:hypothetical protein
MKYLLTSVTIGACLLLSSGDVFADNPHPTGTSGQLGTGSAALQAGCGPAGTTANPIAQPSPPGQALNGSNSSPFPGAKGMVNPTGAASKYAGAGKGSYGANSPADPNVNSQRLLAPSAVSAAPA